MAPKRKLPETFDDTDLNEGLPSELPSHNAPHSAEGSSPLPEGKKSKKAKTMKKKDRDDGDGDGPEKKVKRVWTSEEVALLKELVIKHGKKWVTVTAEFHKAMGRTSSQLQSRWAHVEEPKLKKSGEYEALGLE